MWGDSIPEDHQIILLYSFLIKEVGKQLSLLVFNIQIEIGSIIKPIDQRGLGITL